MGEIHPLNHICYECVAAKAEVMRSNDHEVIQAGRKRPGHVSNSVPQGQCYHESLEAHHKSTKQLHNLQH